MSKSFESSPFQSQPPAQGQALGGQARQVAPGKTTLTQQLPMPSHQTRTSVFDRPPDEVRLNWLDFVKCTAPPNPFVAVNIIPPSQCPLPENTALQDMNGQLQPGTSKGSPSFVLDGPHWNRRNLAWAKYTQVAVQVQRMQERVAPDFMFFQHAAENAELRALGFVVPAGLERGDLSILAEHQTLAGIQVGSLFSDKNTLSRAERPGRAKAPVEAGAHLQAADSDVQEALGMFRAALDGVQAAGDEARAAKTDIDIAASENEVADAAGGLAELQRRSENVVRAIDFLGDAPTKLSAFASSHSTIGAIGAFVYSLFSQADLETANERLQNAQKRLQAERSHALELRFRAAEVRVHGAMEELGARRNGLIKAIALRQISYSETGRQLGGDPQGALFGAIPIAEYVVAVLHRIAKNARPSLPPYDDESGLGFGIACQHKLQAAFDLPHVISWLQYCHQFCAELAAIWEQRLAALESNRRSIIGVRPGES